MTNKKLVKKKKKNKILLKRKVKTICNRRYKTKKNLNKRTKKKKYIKSNLRGGMRPTTKAPINPVSQTARNKKGITQPVNLLTGLLNHQQTPPMPKAAKAVMERKINQRLQTVRGEKKDWEEKCNTKKELEKSKIGMEAIDTKRRLKDLLKHKLDNTKKNMFIFAHGTGKIHDQHNKTFDNYYINNTTKIFTLSKTIIYNLQREYYNDYMTVNMEYALSLLAITPNDDPAQNKKDIQLYDYIPGFEFTIKEKDTDIWKHIYFYDENGKYESPQLNINDILKPNSYFCFNCPEPRKLFNLATILSLINENTNWKLYNEGYNIILASCMPELGKEETCEVSSCPL